jgi:predicted AAA+ superfamily ATPase
VSAYRSRIADHALSRLLETQPLVVLQGPKGVGKTATARNLIHGKGTDINLERTDVREAVEADLGVLSRRPRPIFVDEWQLWPPVWNELRRLVDDGAEPGSFLVAGSMIPAGARVHSGAGRAVTLRMRPMSLAERGLAAPTVSLDQLLRGNAEIGGSTDLGYADYVAEVFASGFPGIRSLSTPQARMERLVGYLDAVLTKDFAEYGQRVRRPDTLRRWLASYAAATATNAQYSRVLDGATPGDGDKPAKSTTIGYRDALAAMWLLDEVPIWAPGEQFYSRLATTPKHFLADPALAAALLELDEPDLTLPTQDLPAADFGPTAGRLFEALVAQSLQVYAQAVGARVSYFRTRDGKREVDFIVERKRRAVAFEVKLAKTANQEAIGHLLWLKDRAGAQIADAVLVNTGTEAYRRKDGIAVIPAALLGQ